MLAGSADGFTHFGGCFGSKERRQSLQTARHVLVHAAAVLQHPMVTDGGSQHGVPRTVFQQQIISLDVDHAWHMFVPATSFVGQS